MEVNNNRGLKIAGIGGSLGAVLACIGIIVLVIAITAGAMFLGGSSFKSSEVYKGALDAAQNDPQVQAALGTPIEAGAFVTGSMETQGISGNATLNIPIHGPKGKGTLYAAARRENGVWVFYTLAVEVDGSDELITLQR